MGVMPSSESRLCLSVVEKDLDGARSLIKTGADPRALNQDGVSAMYIACKSGSVEFVQLFLSSNVSTTVADVEVAAAGGHTDVLQMLIKNGKAVPGRSLVVAASHGHPNTVSTLLDLKCIPNSQHPDRTALIAAAAGGHPNTVHILLERRADPNLFDRRGHTALHEAAMVGDPDIAAALLTAKADPDASSRFQLARTPLHEAAGRGNVKIVMLLLRANADVNKVVHKSGHGSGRTALMYASICGAFAVVRVLIKHNANVKMQSDDGKTAYDSAIEHNHTAIAAVLVEAMTCSPKKTIQKPTQKPTHQRTKENQQEQEKLLFDLCVDGATDAVRKLLGRPERPSLPLLQIDCHPYGRGITPLFVASKNGNKEIAEFLISHGASIEKPNVHGRTPLFAAIRGGHINIVTHLIRHRANPNGQSRNSTPLICSTSSKHLQIVQLLLATKAKPNLTNAAGVSALVVACQHGYDSIARALLDAKASTNPSIPTSEISETSPQKKDQAGRRKTTLTTPLVAAARNGHDTIISLLLLRGACIGARDGHGKTALEWAEAKGHYKIIRLLIRAANESSPDKDGQPHHLSDFTQSAPLTSTRGSTRHSTRRNARMNAVARTSQIILPDVRNLTSEQLFAFFRSSASVLRLHPDVVVSLHDQGYDGETLLEAPESELHETICDRKVGKFRRLQKVIRILRGEPSPLRLQNPKATVTSIGSRVRRGSHTSRDSDTRTGWLFNESDVKVGKKVGSGSFGTVYIADIKGVDKRAVIKVPLTKVDAKEAQREFIAHAQVGSMRNILEFFGLVRFRGKACLLTEYCALGSLNRLHESPEFDLRKRFWDIARDLCLAVAHLHAQKPSPILHRDIACRNLLVRADWSVVLSDYGLARRANRGHYYDPTDNQSQLPVLWLPPEAIRGDVAYGPKGDVWQIGVALHEILNKGKKPYYHYLGPEHALIRLIASGDIRLRIQTNDQTIADFINLCCSFDRKTRPTALQLIRDRLSCGIEAAKNCGSEAILTALREEAKADVGSEVKVLGICDDDDDDDDECEVVGLFQFGADGSRLGTSSPEVLYAKQGAS